MPPHLGNECFSIPKFFLMISLCISNFSLSRCQKWEKVPTLPRIDHTHSQKGPIAIQLFFFAHQTYGTLLGSLLWALDGGSNDDQLEHSFNEQRLIYLSFLNWHRLHLPYLNTIVIRRHICLDIGIKVLRIIWKKQKRFRFCNGQGYEHEVGRLRRDGKTYLDTSATMFDFAIKPL